jgi:hypothetical protein
MNKYEKALMVAIKPKWLKMILDGTKKFEFRNWKVPVGTVIYFYCTKAKPNLIINNYKENYNLGGFDFVGEKKLNGKVVVKTVVKRTINIEHCQHVRDVRSSLGISSVTAIAQGYNWSQKYALELDQVQAIEPKDVTEFVSYKKSNIAMCDVPLTKPPQSRTWICVKE